jgi:uncharacterized protein YcgI (DUF1989 family)
MASRDRQEVPARAGRALRLQRDERVRLINTHGTQVIDCWAFAADDLGEFMSMEHSRVGLGRVNPRQGDALLTNRRRPILALEEDTSPGVHDTLVAACDRWRYAQLGAAAGHANCTDNLGSALAALGLAPPEVPCPLNLFMNVPVGPGGTLELAPALSRPGDFVVLRAVRDAIVVFSACPQDLVPINGRDMVPRAVHYEILG